ncbi:MAG: LL-diaminopimelate aminotransferase [Bacillus sp. (in: firmicutes)]
MNIIPAQRMASFSSSIFSELATLKSEKQQQGQAIIDLSIGSPDLPPPPFVKEAISALALEDRLYGYPLKGTAEFHHSVAMYYKNKHDITLNPQTEIVQLMGSQDGLVHLPMVLTNPGEYVLVPDPGYTAYATGIAMAGAIPYYMPLTQKNHFLPDFCSIPEEVAQKASMMILNFPGNPIPAMATKELFTEAISFAQKYNIIILHDFAYSELYYGDEKPISFLSLPGSKEVGIEMNSLSKSYNMAGCRVAYAIGNEKIISMLNQLKSNLDYGVFFPIQKAASLALQNGAEYNKEARQIYRRRRDCLVNGLNKIGWEIDTPEAGMFIWAKTPHNYASKPFSFDLINQANVAVTPGIAFGPSGEGYVRIALVQDEHILQKAIQSIEKSDLI